MLKSDNMLLEFEKRPVPQLPKAYEGKSKSNGGYTLSTPREWTAEEIEWIKDLREKGFTIEEIAASVGRTLPSVQIKLKRLGKKNERYNEKHRAEKYELNCQFFDMLRPKTVLDLYCGTTSWWSDKTEAVTNDIDKEVSATYNQAAEMLIHKLYYDGCRYDVVDLDPFGSAYECLDLAVKMADKGLKTNKNIKS